jgi:catechol 2,3-dioxygenase-like lactoylglutathione lyase family enzyme
MMENVQIESVSVPVSDQDQAKEFYVRDPDGNALVLWEHAGAQAEDVASEEPGLRYQPVG